ncbi:MAG: biotin--[acetyl-CoA-carboxylase] ligase [Flavobacteriaceae bacterium]|nr:biotin--[acetyl-CoA-carboxylase] ligase [Flavobacteriaceae bacterium]
MNLFCHLIAYFAAKNAILLDFQFIRPIGNIHLFYISSCDSTQNAIITLIEQGAMGLANGSLPLALYSDDQQNGRGQLGNDWNSEVGKNITMTIAFPIKSSQNIDVVQWNKALSVSTLAPIQKQLNEPLFLKWPNDIVTETQKLGGLLMEMTQIGDQKFLLLGIGINANQIHWKNESKATSLGKISGEVINIPGVMDAILFSLDEIWENMNDLHAEYRKSLWKIGKEVILEVQHNAKLGAAEITMLNQVSGVHVHGILLDIDQVGRIVIADAEGKLLAFHHGQVRLQF